MRTVSIKLTDEEYEALNSYSVSANEKLKHIVRSHVSIRRLGKDNTVEDFAFDKIIATRDMNDRATLTDAYSIYTDWCLDNKLNPLTKQQFRSAMEDMGIVYETAGGGRKIFRFVRIEEEKDNIDDIEETWGD